MSGGYFDYNQYQISEIIDCIDRVYSSALADGKRQERDDDYEYRHNFDNPDVMGKLEEAMYYLKMAYIYTQRIDWLLSGDDSEESFLKRLRAEVSKVKKPND